MTSRAVEGEGLRTTYASAPLVHVTTRRDGPTSLRLEFSSSPVTAAGQAFQVTRLSFEGVVAYAWNHFEFHRVPSNPNDSAFGLIEILDSPIVAEVVSTRRYIGDPLKHYRITFDDHGTYDIVGARLTIDHTMSASDAYP
jgi:hypothetical protein